MKNFKGKAIYNPSGKAGEYSYWACNFYVGCSNGCEYCYYKKGILAGAMGGNTPKLKKYFKDESDALEVFEKELKANLSDLQKHGLFFSFTTDPMLPKTIELTINAVELCDEHLVTVKILTKRADWVDNFLEHKYFLPHRTTGIAFGFTLTGHDELELNASTNAERIEAMRKLHEAGFKTWASIEPVIDINDSLYMISKTAGLGVCNLYKIGLLSGEDYDKILLRKFIVTSIREIEYFGNNAKIYFKDSLLKQAGISRSELPNNCVGRDYNIFNS